MINQAFRSLPLVTLSEQNGNWWSYFINHHWYYRLELTYLMQEWQQPIQNNSAQTVILMTLYLSTKRQSTLVTVQV